MINVFLFIESPLVIVKIALVIVTLLVALQVWWQNEMNELPSVFEYYTSRNDLADTVQSLNTQLKTVVFQSENGTNKTLYLCKRDFPIDTSEITYQRLDWDTCNNSTKLFEHINIGDYFLVTEAQKQSYFKTTIQAIEKSNLKRVSILQGKSYSRSGTTQNYNAYLYQRTF